MISKIIGAGLIAISLPFVAAAPAFADQPPNKGQPGATEDKSTGAPTNPNGFGTVTSQLASTDHSVGTHASSFAPGQDPDAVPAQRLGVGNVSRTDGGLAAFAGVPNGDHPGDHAAAIGAIDGNDATNADGHPGKP